MQTIRWTALTLCALLALAACKPAEPAEPDYAPAWEGEWLECSYKGIDFAVPDNWTEADAGEGVRYGVGDDAVLDVRMQNWVDAAAEGRRDLDELRIALTEERQPLRNQPGLTQVGRYDATGFTVLDRSDDDRVLVYLCIDLGQNVMIAEGGYRKEQEIEYRNTVDAVMQSFGNSEHSLRSEKLAGFTLEVPGNWERSEQENELHLKFPDEVCGVTAVWHADPAEVGGETYAEAVQRMQEADKYHSVEVGDSPALRAQLLAMSPFSEGESDSGQMYLWQYLFIDCGDGAWMALTGYSPQNSANVDAVRAILDSVRPDAAQAPEGAPAAETFEGLRFTLPDGWQQASADSGLRTYSADTGYGMVVQAVLKAETEYDTLQSRLDFFSDVANKTHTMVKLGQYDALRLRYEKDSAVTHHLYVDIGERIIGFTAAYPAKEEATQGAVIEGILDSVEAA